MTCPAPGRRCFFIEKPPNGIGERSLAIAPAGASWENEAQASQHSRPGGPVSDFNAVSPPDAAPEPRSPLSRFAAFLRPDSNKPNSAAVVRLELVADAAGNAAPIEVEGQAHEEGVTAKRKSLRHFIGPAITGASIGLLLSTVGNQLGIIQTNPVGAAKQWAVSEAISAAAFAGGWPARAMIHKAQETVARAQQRGYFDLGVASSIGNHDPAALWTGGDEPEATQKVSYSIDGKGSLVFSMGCKIQISASAAKLGMVSEDPLVDIASIALHEATHCLLTDPQKNKYDGALAQGAAGEFWKSLAWAEEAAFWGRGGRLDKPLAQIKENGSFSGLKEESNADTLAMIARAADLGTKDWSREISRLIIHRQATSLMTDDVADTHQTQASLMILAALGHDKLRSLTGAQAQALADAVATDGAILTAGRHGWQTADYAKASDAILRIERASAEKGGVEEWIRETQYGALRPFAARFSQETPQNQAATAKAAQMAARQWENGAVLDYGFIAPHMIARLPAMPKLGYELWKRDGRPDQLAASLGGDTSDEAEAARRDAEPRARAMLAEWASIARALELPDASAVGDTTSFIVAYALSGSQDKAKMQRSSFWAPALKKRHEEFLRSEKAEAPQEMAGGVQAPKF